ncbi:hypothetical protein [Aeromonas caviae]|uniref:hypothetical protein n=1 Tax=Aeromonas caviae TaxID=648 RepID=UPI0028DE899A|nr:hypothetical protein [Aeromonas caviae]MDT8953426.1 hypothetical protein [Aeromonas caviae]
MKIDSKNIMLYFVVLYPFSFYTFIDIRIFGTSMSFLRDVAFFLALVFFLLSIRVEKESSKVTGNVSFVLLFLFCFNALVLMSFIVSSDRMLVLPFLLRSFILLLIVTITEKLEYDDFSLMKMVNYLGVCFLVYTIGSLLTIPVIGFSSAGGIEGLAGQHFSKFIFLLSSIFYLSLYLRFNKSLGNLCGLVISLVAMFLVLQRGAIIAFVIAAFVIFVAGNYRRKIVGTIVFLMLLPFFLFYLSTDDSIMQYAFFEGYGPDVIFSSLLDGTFDWSMIRARGRFELMEIITYNSDLTVLGNGAGYVKRLLSDYFFIDKEPHNDFLFILYDFGMVTLLILIFLILSMLGIDIERNGVNSPRKVLLIFSKASILGMSFWMIVSNVLIYSTYALMIPFFVIISASKFYKEPL